MWNFWEFESPERTWILWNMYYLSLYRRTVRRKHISLGRNSISVTIKILAEIQYISPLKIFILHTIWKLMWYWYSLLLVFISRMGIFTMDISSCFAEMNVFLYFKLQFRIYVWKFSLTSHSTEFHFVTDHIQHFIPGYNIILSFMFMFLLHL